MNLLSSIDTNEALHLTPPARPPPKFKATWTAHPFPLRSNIHFANVQLLLRYLSCGSLIDNNVSGSSHSSCSLGAQFTKYHQSAQEAAEGVGPVIFSESRCWPSHCTRHQSSRPRGGKEGGSRRTALTSGVVHTRTTWCPLPSNAGSDGESALGGCEPVAPPLLRGMPGG